MQLELSRIVIDGGTQPRVAIDDAVVADYAEALREGTAFPPVVVFHDGAKYWLADGFHRYHAHRHAGREEIEAEVREGTLREAVLYAVGANGEHGLRRSNGDKRRAVVTMLTNDLVAKDDEGNPWTDNQIAVLCRVDHKTVGKYRREVLRGQDLTWEFPSENPDDEPTSGDLSPSQRAYTTKHGTKSVMNTANIGRARKRTKPTGRLATEALTPRRNPHGENGPVPMKAVSLPLNNPRQAAASMIGVYGEAYMAELMTELQQLLKDTPHACN